MAAQKHAVRIDTITETVEGACGSCGFDSLRRVRGYHLSAKGVTRMFNHVYCGRCKADERRARDE